jgi:molybdopterin-binding protein
VRIEPLEGVANEGGSRLHGTIAEIVFLGMYTQFHVDTRAGRVVSHRLADESLEGLEVGSEVALDWAPEHASLLDAAPLAVA